MKIKSRYIVLFSLVSTLLLTACSTQKNTRRSRFYHQFTTHYNVAYNAQVNFETGIKAINDGVQDDYTKRIPMFAISNVEVQKTATAQMDIVIEKCRKVIKNHSITKKPKRNHDKMRDPKYRAFYDQYEFVPGVKAAWILLAQAEYNEGKFLESAATCGYIQRHYPKDIDLVNQARMWQSRAYGQMNWKYESQQAFDQIKSKTLSPKLSVLYAETQAYVYLQDNKELEALPYLELAAKGTKDKVQRRRYYYILGQVAYEQGQYKKAGEAFHKVLKSFPPYLMQFNAQLLAYQCDKTNTSKMIKKLERMGRSLNNKDYLDQIYGTEAHIYMQKPDTSRAIKAYTRGIEESTRNGIDKAMNLIELGQIYFARKDYIRAEPLYTEASQIIPVDHKLYPEVSLLATNLGDLAAQQSIIVLQDSLQVLSRLPEDKKLEAIDRVIEGLIAQEKQAAEDAANQQALDKANASSGSMGAMGLPPMIGGGAGASNDWYFYNDALKKAGASQFQQKFGTRKLSDNWGRVDKNNPYASDSFGDEGGDAESGEDGKGPEGSNPNDSTAQDALSAPNDSLASDDHNPEYYLAQLPKTEADYQASDDQIAEALYKLAGIYLDQMNDTVSSLDTYEVYQTRFPDHPQRVDSYYSCYRIYKMQDQALNATDYQQRILNEYPESKYAIMLSTPNYVETMQRMYATQDSIYQSTYLAYTTLDFRTVRLSYTQIKTLYPLSELLPKFAFLNALSYGRSGQKETFALLLDTIVETYPNADITPMAKGMRALIGQGKTAQKNTTTSSLNQKRLDEQKTELASVDTAQFSSDAIGAYKLVLRPKNQVDSIAQQLLFDVAAFNFTKFMIKSFDVKQATFQTTQSIVIEPFLGLKEALWYQQLLLSAPELQGRVTLDVCDRILISQDNWKLILSGKRTLEEYTEFYNTIKH